MPAETSHDTQLVVLVHGAWHGAWSWATLQSTLDARGIPSIAVDLPGHGASPDQIGDLHGDAAAVGRTLDAVRERSGRDEGVVLVGHSYGGAVISLAAAGRDDVEELLYVAAFALNADESVMGALSSFDRRPVALSAAMVPADDGSSTTLDPEHAVAALYGSSNAQLADAALARLDPQATATMTQVAGASALGTIPSTYVVCARDEAVHPDHQAVMADRCDRTVVLDTDHSPFMSAVDELADVIEVAARRGRS